MGKKLLVADDSLTIQKVIKLALSSEGYDILAVSDGAAAIQAIANEMPDVVLIDVALPAGDAYEVKKAINQNPNLSGVGFILMSSAFERVDEQHAQEVSFQARLIKPFDPAHLRKAVSQVLEKSKVVRPAGMGTSATSQNKGGSSSLKKETSRVLESLSTGAMPPPPPPMTSAPTGSMHLPDAEDLPPMSDMMPTLNENSRAPDVTEDEFKLEISDVAQPITSSDESEEEVTQTRNLENDIKDLTESTIKMSGLDDFEWNLDDSNKMRDKTRTLEMPSPVKTASKGEPSGPDFTVLPRALDDGGSNFLSMGVSAPPKPKGSGIGAEFASPLIEMRNEERMAPRESAAAPAMNRAEMEQLIRREFELAIERIARDVVPQIAEQLIRKEIEKLLAEN